MYGFYVVMSAETASFRDPGGQLYHTTFPLPPVSTIIGIAGAAMGVPFHQVWEYFQTHDIFVGTKDISKNRKDRLSGKGLDLWKYQKIVSNEVRSDILKREFLFRPIYRLYYGCEEKKPVEQLRQSFLSPAWALSLGTSDDIACLDEISKTIENVTEVKGGAVNLNSCLIPGDQSDNFTFDWEVIRNTSIRTSLRLPLVKRLPIGYTFSPDGERKGRKYRLFTFLSDIQQLKKPCPAYVFGEDIVPLISVVQG